MPSIYFNPLVKVAEKSFASAAFVLTEKSKIAVAPFLMQSTGIMLIINITVNKTETVFKINFFIFQIIPSKITQYIFYINK